MTKSKKIIVSGVATIAIVGIIAGWYAVPSVSRGCSIFVGGSGSPASLYFSEALQNGVIEKKGGQPHEGFEPFMFMEVYPGLQSSDFNCVKAYGGFYTMESGQAIFNFYKSISGKRSPGERSIIPTGMNRLLQNIADRLGRPFPHSNVEVDDIINTLSVPPVTVATSTPRPSQPIFLEYHPSSVYPVEWKTFESQKLGFSFEYPSEWGTAREEIIDYAGGQNQTDGYVASVGKAYFLMFSLVSYVSYEYRTYGVGQSDDFAAGREFIHTDYKGDSKRSAAVISEVGINLTARCSEAGYPVGPPTSHVIKFNLPGEEISGVMLVFPVLSVADTQKYNQLIDDFMKKEISCRDMWGDNAGGEKAKQIMAKLVAKEFEISEMLRTGENFDKESQMNLAVYNRILKSAQIPQ